MKHIVITIDFHVEEKDFNNEKLQKAISDIRNKDAANELFDNCGFPVQNENINIVIK